MAWPRWLVLAVTACAGSRIAPETDAVSVRLLPLAAPLAGRDVEISGMSWHGDTLVLVPQYPERFGDVLFALERGEILARLDGSGPGEPLRARTIPFDAPGLRRLPGYEGLESIAFE